MSIAREKSESDSAVRPCSHCTIASPARLCPTSAPCASASCFLIRRLLRSNPLRFVVSAGHTQQVTQFPLTLGRDQAFLLAERERLPQRGFRLGVLPGLPQSVSASRRSIAAESAGDRRARLAALAARASGRTGNDGDGDGDAGFGASTFGSAVPRVSILGDSVGGCTTTGGTIDRSGDTLGAGACSGGCSAMIAGMGVAPAGSASARARRKPVVPATDTVTSATSAAIPSRARCRCTKRPAR